MPYKEIIIEIYNQDIHFSPILSILSRKTNLQLDQMTFKSKDRIYWKIEIQHYFEETKSLHVKVLDYFYKNVEAFKRQTTDKLIERVIFEELDWQKLRLLLQSFSPEVPFNLASYEIPEESSNIKRTFKPNIESHQAAIVPNVDNLKINFHVKFQDATFKDGFVVFKKYIKQVRIQVEFKILNAYILEEFDNIKLWFSKMLKSKRFDVAAIITTIDRHFSEASATSSIIDMITPNIIESVKYGRTLALTRPPKTTNPYKSLYSTEDIFNLIDPDIKNGNVFNQSEPDIIKSLTQNDYVRNRKQLEYLSVIKQTTKRKIHYTLNPHFGFLFLIEGKGEYHFVWELLHSHSTYIWSIDKEEKEVVPLYSKIEEILNIIRLIGREEYKKTYSNKDLEFALNFKSIEHQDISINLEDGFTKWKSKLDELLT